MRTLLLLLLIPLLLSVNPGFAQSSPEGLHLVVGYALGQLELEGGRFKEEHYLSTGFSTACVYHILPFTLGVKSIASIGAHNRDEGLTMSDSDVPLRRYIQHVSLSPYFGMRRDLSAKLPFGLQFELGPSSAISSLKHKDGYKEQQGLQRRKSSFVSKGFELALGLYQKPKPNTRDFTLMFGYQTLQSERQYLVDVTKFKNALTLSKHKSRDVQALEIYSLAFNYYLF